MLKLTITRALKELKLLDKRISEKTTQIKFLDVEQNKYKGKALESQKPIEEFNKKVLADYQSLSDLMNRRDAMKSAICLSNATTKVKVAGLEMSVSDAIDGKNSIEFKENLLKTMRNQRAHFQKAMSDSRTIIDRKVEEMISLNVGKDKKVDKDDFEKIAQPFVEANYLNLVDPLKIDEKIEQLTKYIEDFKSDVDIALSETNARTEIEIPD